MDCARCHSDTVAQTQKHLLRNAASSCLHPVSVQGYHRRRKADKFGLGHPSCKGVVARKRSYRVRSYYLFTMSGQPVDFQHLVL
ncbi:hypothetical protein KIN20_035643 [Parelaphostrongylus tenuis]|uniref:Uncharacterized protein n=1 Tax=Parelaphostrongylus tenuis TaxID=148309 RepID=A0AAD5RBR2_PARTN|nr:hypothetical protein KIN20_035643 [Parelaphostrongylus tenuis]